MQTRRSTGIVYFLGIPIILLRRKIAPHCAVFGGLLCTSAIHAQSTVLSGTVRDPGQQVVVGVTVNLDGPSTHRTTATDGAGRYSFTGVALGAYMLSTQQAGFNPVSFPLTITDEGASTHDLTFSTAGTNASVTVQGDTSGTASDGYYVSRTQSGVLGSAPIVDQPAVITAVPFAEIRNTQAKTVRDAIQFLPLVNFNEQEGDQIIRPSTRGIQGSIAQNTRQDGMAFAITGANAIEQYENLQVQNGLGSSFYGPANPSGIFDFILKRPTGERSTNLYLEQDSSTIGTIYGDAGGRFGPRHLFGYRSNLLYSDGGAYVANARQRRRLAEFAFDARPTPKSLVDVSYSAYDVVQRGYPGWFSYGPNPASTARPRATFLLPAAPDPTRVGYGQPGTGVNLTTQSSSARYHYQISPAWRLVAGGLAQRLNRFIDTGVNTLTNNAGNYNVVLASGFAPRFDTVSDLGYITGTAHLLGARHDLVFGSEGYRFRQFSYPSPPASSLLLGSASIAAPVILPPPAAGLPVYRNLYKSSIINQQGFNIGDLLTLPKHLLVRLAGSQDYFGADNNAVGGKRTGGSNRNGISPSASVLYKPTTWSTAYATFASSLQQGDVAPGNAVNANQALAPYRSTEWELGFKTTDHPLAVTAALFRIQRPFANTDGSNVFRITGLQVNYGAELSAQGLLFHRLLIDGGFTALNARLNQTGIAATNGRRFVGTPAYRSNLLSEYHLPGVQDLVVTGNWQFIGARPVNDENLQFTPAFNTFNLGFRYGRLIGSKRVTLRFTANNLSSVRYYSTISPGDITGTNASSNTAFLGTPRTIATSLQFAF